MKFAAAVLLFAATFTQADVVEHHDRRWQIVDYSVTGTTAEPQGTVHDITFETNGDLWIARTDGLFFYDGYAWKRFGIEHGLPSDACYAVKVTQAGVLWVATDRGCGVFDGERFETHGSEQSLAGPIVRKIREDPDGTLWFCCINWPTLSGSGGLSSFCDGQWRSYGLADGLPSNQLHDYHRNSKGHQYAVTSNGIARRSGDQWVALDIPGFPPETMPLELLEAPNGELISLVTGALGMRHVLMTKEHRWQNISKSATKLLVTREGQIFGTERNANRARIRVMRFQDGQWTPVSAWALGTSNDVSNLIEAPDGAIWGTGNGVFFRWETTDREWAQFSGLAPFRNVDLRDQVWFGRDQETWVLRGDRFVTAPNWEEGTFQERDGQMWYLHDGALVEVSLDSLRVERRHSIEVSQLSRVIMDVDGSVWVHLVHDGRDEVRVYSEGEWKVFPPELYSQGKLHSIKRDARGGVTTVMMSRTGPSQLLLFTSDLSAREISRPPAGLPIEYLWSDRFGIWAAAGNGLFHASTGDNAHLSKVERLQDFRFIPRGLSSSQRATCFFMEDALGGTHLVAFDGQNWETFKGQNGSRFVRTSGRTDRSYFSVGEKLYFYSEEHETPLRFGQSPLNGTVTHIIHQANGDIWLRQEGRTVRYRPRKTQPRAAVRLAASKIMSGDDAATHVVFTASNRFEPHSDSKVFNYSWRIDDGAWSRFSEASTETLALANLPTGDHVLQLKVINSAGIASDTVANAEFVVYPIPLLQRPWFLPVVALSVLAISGLALVAASATVKQKSYAVKLKTYADGLEHLVQDRTAELRDRQHRETELAENKLEKLRRKLILQTRLATIGQMTASIAHEIRNPLGAVRNAAFLLKRYISADDSKCPKYLEIIDQEVDVVDHVIRDMLEMARSTEPINVPFDLSQVVRDIFNRSDKNDSVCQHLHAIPDPFLIDADQGQIRQVLQNLIVNANQALDGDGEINVELTQNGNDAIIAVRDTGPGVSDEHRDNLFEPLFTTKAKGTGLGLTICRQLIERHGGSIELQNNEGTGALFVIRLPQDSSQTQTSPASNPKHEFHEQT
ncbi:MAG: ATP-binding protein [Fuerstiella sp.]